MQQTKQRLDMLMVERKLTESRAKAQRLILAGAVRVNGQPALKPGANVAAEAVITVAHPERFVGRGGLKLERAFEVFAIEVGGKICLDIGASTGGFTDCLLQHGARKVYAVDVGQGLLHWRLRHDPRVGVMENINARYLTPADFELAPEMATVDVSFISLTKIMPAVKTVLQPGSLLVTLIKPQFEASRAEIGRGGVVREPAVHARVLAHVREFGEQTLEYEWKGLCESPIKGPAGNIEFLALWKKP